jgi:O-methyltransferase involved in polyketide biosynthesis
MPTARIAPHVTLIPGDYVTDGLIDLLRSNGFDFDVPTYLIWEGNVMYMPLASDKHTMLQLKRHVKRFCLSFDYLTESVITKTTGDASHEPRRELRSDGRAYPGLTISILSRVSWACGSSRT